MDNQLLEGKILYKVMKNMPFGILVSKEGAQRKVYYVNPAAYEMLGYTKEEYIAKVEENWCSFMNIDMEQMLKDHQEEISKGEEFEVIAKTTTKDGRKIYLQNRIVVKSEVAPICYMNITDVTERIERQNELKEERDTLKVIASQDSMTKLLNRGTMESKIRAALAHVKGDQQCAYIMLDIDNFKTINDSYGHGTGDMLILELSDILKRHFEEDAYIGRMGGDEFAVFVRNADKRDSIIERANCVLREFREVNGGRTMATPPTVSVGVVFQKKSETDFEKLYHCADMEMYGIKNKEKNGVSVIGI